MTLWNQITAMCLADLYKCPCIQKIFKWMIARAMIIHAQWPLEIILEYLWKSTCGADGIIPLVRQAVVPQWHLLSPNKSGSQTVGWLVKFQQHRNPAVFCPDAWQFAHCLRWSFCDLLQRRLPLCKLQSLSFDDWDFLAYFTSRGESGDKFTDRAIHDWLLEIKEIKF